MNIGHNSRLVAIVDDDQSVQRSLQDLIESDGLSAICFGSAEQFQDSEDRSKAIELYPDQKVVSSGLYALVRHPMYMGDVVFFVGAALSLASWWGLLAFLLMMPAFIWRIFEEEGLLLKNLPDYAEYKNKVRHRLVPFIW